MFPAYGVSKRRREIIQLLAAAYSEDNLSLEDYERRVQMAERATTIEALRAIVFDFPDDPIETRSTLADSGPSGPVRSSLHPTLCFVPAILLFLALLPFPYGYYILLRLGVGIAAGFLTYDEYRLRGRVSGWTVALAIVALLFNPIIPVHLTREIWVPINIATGLMFLLHWRVRS